MRVWMGNDHGGYALKLALAAHLRREGVEVVDVGSDCEEIVRYPYYAAQVARAVLEGAADLGVLLCSTGIGMSIAANKYPGVRAALCHSAYEARMTRAHNDSNVLCLGGQVIGPRAAIDVLDAFMAGAYQGGRHEISLSLIREAERVNMTGARWLPDLEKMR